MSALVLTPAARAARNAALLALADSGAGRSAIRVYTAGDVLLAAQALARPCGSITPEGRIALAMDLADPALVLTSDAAAYAQWVAADGSVLATGLVTDAAGSGPWRLEGASGTALYAGGALLLTTCLIG